MLRQLVIGKKLEETNEQLRALTEAWTALTERRAELQKREAELEEAIKEVNAETPDEEKKIVEDKTAEWEKDDAALTGEETENQQARAAIEKKIADLTAELDELNARSAAKIATPEPEKRKEGTVVTMETRKFFGMNLQERDAFMARQDVKDFLERVRACGREERAVTGSQLLIPDVMLGLIRQKAEEASKLLKHVDLRRVSGTSRMNVAGAIPEAVWTEMCAKLNELSIGFTNIELDGYKVGGFIAICKALLEDSDINLATEIITMLGKAIGLALDKAILYGTGTKMPLGIVTRLAQTAAPSGYPATQRAWADLHTSNLKTISGKTGIQLFQAILAATSAAKGKYATGGAKFWAMNESTKLTLISEAMNINAAGAIVSAQNDTLPIVGGKIETLDFIPDGKIIGGYGELYLLAERAGNEFARSDEYRFVEEQVVFKGTARYDGAPVIAEGFVGIGIGTSVTAPAANDVTFAQDSANP